MKRVVLGLTLLGGTAMMISACMEKNSTAPETKTISREEKLKRGEYLVTIAGCNDCHTPKVMTENGPGLDMKRLLSGHRQDEALPMFDEKGNGKGIIQSNMSLTAWSGPWGISYSANISPDKQTGIGNWTLEQFKTALKKGKSKGLPDARPLLPPMPWFNLVNMPDEDVEAIFTYLQSLPAVSNQVPAPISPADLAKGR